MGEATDQIETHIENTREDLGSNLRELEKKVKSVTDWRQHFKDNPMTLIGVAFGGGILLATMMGGRRSRRHSGGLIPEISSAPSRATDQQKHRALETWDSIKGALIGVAATRFKDFVVEIVPGFQEHFQRTENAKGSVIDNASIS